MPASHTPEESAPTSPQQDLVDALSLLFFLTAPQFSITALLCLILASLSYGGVTTSTVRIFHDSNEGRVYGAYECDHVDDKWIVASCGIDVHILYGLGILKQV
jgi:hypothetical protein